MKVATLIVVSVLAVGVLWLAGEQHRRNCIASGNKGCSVLPWVAGDARKAATGTLTRQGCERLRLENAYAESTDQIRPVPPECR